jgi:hypothetical protein
MIQHTTLETAKKLHDAGIKIDSQYTYFEGCKESKPTVFAAWGYKSICPAPTFCELWALLPNEITKGGTFHKELNHRTICYADSYSKVLLLHDILIQDGNLAEAAAQLLLWCHENGYLKENKG